MSTGAIVILVCAALFVASMVGAVFVHRWNERRVTCGGCHRVVPSWFADDFQTGETLCSRCTERMPYPRDGETEDAYVARWQREGRPRA